MSDLSERLKKLEAWIQKEDDELCYTPDPVPGLGPNTPSQQAQQLQEDLMSRGILQVNADLRRRGFTFTPIEAPSSMDTLQPQWRRAPLTVMEGEQSESQNVINCPAELHVHSQCVNLIAALREFNARQTSSLRGLTPDIVIVDDLNTSGDDR